MRIPPQREADFILSGMVAIVVLTLASCLFALN